MPSLITLYATIAAFLLLRLAVSLVRLRAIRANAVALRRDGRVNIVVSDKVSAPISWGLLRPIIVLDPQTATRDSEAIVDHELAHITRGDWPMLLLAQVVCALHWLNPLAWWLRRELSRATEAAADDFALRRGSAAADYAHELLALAPVRVTRAATAAASSATELRARLTSILDPNRNRNALTRTTMLIGAAIAATVTMLVAGVSPLAETTSIIRALEAIHNPHFTSLARAMRERNYEHRRGDESGLFSDRAAIGPLTQALRDRDATIRRLGAWGLSEMRIRETAPSLVPLLRDPDPLVRGEAARALGDLDYHDAIDDTIALLDDRDSHVRTQALHALGDLRDSRALDAVRRVVATEGDPAAADEARWALHELN
jgi:hypothetical protein